MTRAGVLPISAAVTLLVTGAACEAPTGDPPTAAPEGVAPRHAASRSELVHLKSGSVRAASAASGSASRSGVGSGSSSGSGSGPDFAVFLAQHAAPPVPTTVSLVQPPRRADRPPALVALPSPPPDLPAAVAPVAPPRESAVKLKCEPPYFYDSSGVRVFKEECL
jgi:hypothetical protein